MLSEKPLPRNSGINVGDIAMSPAVIGKDTIEINATDFLRRFFISSILP